VHSPTKPVLVFVSSRRQTRLTALDLITYAVADERPQQFLHMTEAELEACMLGVKDAALRHCLQFGIGLHHAGLPDKDRSLVEKLYVECKIQVLVATSTLAWGVNTPAHLVVIKGTEFYDAPTKRYVDFPITDVLQMMGRAGRPQYDRHGVAVIMVHEPKKQFYKRFLYEPFPVESSLQDQARAAGGCGGQNIDSTGPGHEAANKALGERRMAAAKGRCGDGVLPQQPYAQPQQPYAQPQQPYAQPQQPYAQPQQPYAQPQQPYAQPQQPYAQPQQPYEQPQQPYAQPQQPYVQPQQPYAQPYNAAMTQAPMPMHMPHIENLESIPGVVVKETSSVVDAVMESIGGAYEAANKYHIKAMPGDKRPATVHGESGSWLPTGAEIDNLPQVFYVEEDSSCCLRATLAYFGGLNLRALTLNYYQGTSRNITVDRPCMLGACCCCPLEMSIMNQGQLVGMVKEDCDSCCGCCWEQCCLCTCTHKVMVGSSRVSMVHKYSLKNYACCCGRVNNCCGATCCKPNFFIDVVEPDGKLASVIQKTYGGDKGCAACCRCTFDFSNYILPFPPKATHWDRVALLTGLLSVEYAYHSRQGGENNDS
ncbi:Activating signal cointegrator 1 complex subunit 3, partial [Tetrabaena socialis]